MASRTRASSLIQEKRSLPRGGSLRSCSGSRASSRTSSSASPFQLCPVRPLLASESGQPSAAKSTKRVSPMLKILLKGKSRQVSGFASRPSEVSMPHQPSPCSIQQPSLDSIIIPVSASWCWSSSERRGESLANCTISF